jgi:hypothetical protein
MAKFYFVKFTHLETGKVLYKFGSTLSKDILNRFNPTSYPERVGYLDFDIQPTFSWNFYTLEEAKKKEEEYLNRYSSNRVDISTYLGKPQGYYTTDNLTGISEFRSFTPTQAMEIRNDLYESRPY